jgi:hypothetical protein
MLGRDTKAYSQIRGCLTQLIEGMVLSVDPSIGSTSSMPGWAVYRAGVLMASGTIEIDASLPVWKRLRRLVHGIRKLYKLWEPDVCVYEDIPAQRHGGGNAEAHASLLKAVGAILSVSGPDYYVGLHPLSWKKMIRSTYVKGDREDAEEIGYIAIQEARRIREEDPPSQRKAFSTSNRKRRSRSSQASEQAKGSSEASTTSTRSNTNVQASGD